MTQPEIPSSIPQGTPCRIVFDAGGRKDREAIFRFLAVNKSSLDEGLDEFMFDARPEVGTQTIERRNIRQLWQCHPDEKIMLPRTYRGETRLI